MLVPFLLSSLRLHVRDMVILGRIGLNPNILPPLLMHFVTIPHTYQKPILTCSERCPLVQVVACVTHDMEAAGWLAEEPIWWVLLVKVILDKLYWAYFPGSVQLSHNHFQQLKAVRRLWKQCDEEQ